MGAQPILIIVIQALDIYTWILIARILASWLPNISWYNQPWRTLDALTEPVMAPFRRLIPPIGSLDISPIILFFVLNLAKDALRALAFGMM